MKRFELLRRGTPDLPHFECGPFNHLGTSPYISVCFILKKFLERKAGENTEKYSIFATMKEYEDFQIASVFNPHDLPDYESHSAVDCPLCKRGERIDALINSFGCSML